jgi:MSHA biogenesis protein MshM
MLAYGEGLQKITASHVKLAIKDTEAATQTKHTLLISCVGVLVVMIALSYAYFGWLGFAL